MISARSVDDPDATLSPNQIRNKIEDTFKSGTRAPGTWSLSRFEDRRGNIRYAINGALPNGATSQVFLSRGTSYQKAGRLRVESGTRQTYAVDLSTTAPDGSGSTIRIYTVTAKGESGSADVRSNKIQESLIKKIKKTFGVDVLPSHFSYS